MPPQKFRVKGKFESVSDVRFTTNSYTPYQMFRLIEQPNEFNYFGNYDLAGIPYGADMEFHYEKRGKFLNVRELPGWDSLPRLNLKELKENYMSQGSVDQESGNENQQQKGESSNSADDCRNNAGRMPDDMELKTRMNAGNTARYILDLACSAAANKDDGSMDEESFEKYFSLLMDNYRKGVMKIYRINLGDDTDEE